MGGVIGKVEQELHQNASNLPKKKLKNTTLVGNKTRNLLEGDSRFSSSCQMAIFYQSM